jgi:hypothetical protein
MSRFKDRLWSDLVRVHGTDLSRLSRPPARSRRRPRMVAGTGLGLAVAGTAAALLVGTAGTSPAFAVTKNRDGSITVSISRIAAIPGANARLRALGYRARLVPVRAACGLSRIGPPGASPRGLGGAPPPGLPGAPPPGPRRQILRGARFNPHRVPPGLLLVIPAWRKGRRILIRPAHMIRGQAPPCLPLPPPPALRLQSCCPQPSTGRPSGQVPAGPLACGVVRPGRGRGGNHRPH